ncbi:MAG: hypothetical protein LBF86_07200 [Helicobacteraceae bacterium]|jgi:hypothetical protein|nr:hypothetical protein [Helicobacteraceae bacterium]
MGIFIRLLLIATIAGADEYLIGYRQSSAKHAILSEKLTIAKAMVVSKSARVKNGFSFEIEPRESELSVTKLLEAHQDELLENLFKNGVLLSDAAESRRRDVGSKTVLTFPSARIGVFVKEDMVTILVYENSDR